ncbi:MAG: hypothetical protein GVY19_06955 [Bacteroidetes bacterium]|jgi:hypothetical protein|nr:hypothetical protein [Bacteroidota bacterium]
MKKICYILTLFFFTTVLVKAQGTDILVAQCAASAGENVTYLKDFVVELEAATAGEKPPQAKFSMVLSKNTMYRFTICTAPDSEGEAIIQLYDMNTLLGSSFIMATGKSYPGFNFKCQKTGVYHVFISIKDGKPGRAVGILSFVEKL